MVASNSIKEDESQSTTTISKGSAGTKKNKTWLDMINQPVHTAEDVDIGDIDALSRDFVVVKRGYLKEHYYYIPMTKVEGWDDINKVLWLKVAEDEVKKNYEREIMPDPDRYYTKERRGYSSTFPELTEIPPKHQSPLREAATNYANDDKRYGCALCKEKFEDEDKPNKHVAAVH
jgi:hypothetical protein